MKLERDEALREIQASAALEKELRADSALHCFPWPQDTIALRKDCVCRGAVSSLRKRWSG